MSALRKLIDELTEFGINPNVELSNKCDVLKKLLVQIYLEFLSLKPDFDEKNYEDEPDFNYKSVRKNVESNFPDFGWYSIVLDPIELIPNAIIASGDAIDDLTDIIKDLLAIKWRMENTSEIDALWHFELSMRTHSEQHLVDLLKYIIDKKG